MLVWAKCWHLEVLKMPTSFENGTKYWVLTTQCSAKVSPNAPIWADHKKHLQYRTIPHTFTYPIVPTTIGKSWVVLCFYINNCNTPHGPARQIIVALVSIWCGRGILIQCADSTLGLGYYNIQFLWYKMLQRPRQKIKQKAMCFYNEI